MSRALISAGAIAAALFLPLSSAQAQLFLVEPTFVSGPASLDEPGLSQPMPGATDEEKRANLAWGVRAALNVAALQCQFAPSLQAVGNYNDFLRHHSVELEQVRTTLTRYFTRTAGKTGQKMLDQYTTRTYNSFSTLYGQLGFCQTAAKIGRGALAVPKGGFTAFSAANIRELVSSLKPAGEGFFRFSYSPLAIQTLTDPCVDRKGKRIKKCG